MISVSALYIYPVKACRGIEVQGFRLDELGPQLDRRFMVVDEHGRFISAHDAPRLSQIVPTLLPTAIALRAPGMQVLKLPLALPDGARAMEVEVWKQRGPALIADADSSAWFCEWLERACTLVWMPRSPLRRVDPAYSPEDAYTAFSDGFPVSLLSAASLADLAKRAETSLTAERFRPSIVVSGCEAYAEDGWKRIRIGAVPFDVVKPRAIADTGEAPFPTLAAYRKQGDEVLFGQSCVHRELGMVRVSDAVEVVA